MILNWCIVCILLCIDYVLWLMFIPIFRVISPCFPHPEYKSHSSSTLSSVQRRIRVDQVWKTCYHLLSLLMGDSFFGVLLDNFSCHFHVLCPPLPPKSIIFPLVGQLKQDLAWYVSQSKIIKSVVYPLTALTLSEAEYKQIMAPVKKAILAKTSINRNYPHDLPCMVQTRKEVWKWIISTSHKDWPVSRNSIKI